MGGLDLLLLPLLLLPLLPLWTPYKGRKKTPGWRHPNQVLTGNTPA